MTNPAKPFTSQELEQLADRTLEHYRAHAEDFREGTRDHDVSQNIAALLRHAAGPAPFTILDFGCGPGRDLATFTQLGHRAIGLEGAEPFVVMARAVTGCEVWQQDFLKLDLPDSYFDGIFANAALFHVPTQELPRVLRELRAALKPEGVLFSSNPRGNDDEEWSGGRFGVHHRLETWRRYVTAAGFAELAHYYRPAGLPCAQQPWLATVWRRAGDARDANNAS
jgi:SAM-dependent methyltransferase